MDGYQWEPSAYPNPYLHNNLQSSTADPTQFSGPREHTSYNPDHHHRALEALQILQNTISLETFQYIISTPECFIELSFLFESLQQRSIDLDWLCAVTARQISKPCHGNDKLMPASDYPKRQVSHKSHCSGMTGTTLTNDFVPSQEGWHQNPAPPGEEMEYFADKFAAAQNEDFGLRSVQADIPQYDSMHSQYIQSVYQPSQMVPTFSPSTQLTPNTNRMISKLHTNLQSMPEERSFVGGLVKTQQDVFARLPEYLHDDTPQQFDTSYNQDDCLSTGHAQSRSMLPKTSAGQGMEMPSKTDTLGRQRSIHLQGRTPIEFNHYRGPRPEQHTYRSPCPQCDRSFVSSAEFVKHIKAEHDQPIAYICLHKLSPHDQEPTCGFRTWSLPTFGRHHTEKHTHCRESQHKSVTEPLLSKCMKEQYKARPRRVWGCWFCIWSTSQDVDLWVRHQLMEHRDQPRKNMSKTWLIRSLLSQDMLKGIWRQETGQQRQIGHEILSEWSTKSHDHIRDKLIEQLETGYWRDLNYFTDFDARRGIVRDALAAAITIRPTSIPHMTTDMIGGKRSRDTSSPIPTAQRFKESILRTQRSKSGSDHDAVELAGPGGTSPDLEQARLSPRSFFGRKGKIRR